MKKKHAKSRKPRPRLARGAVQAATSAEAARAARTMGPPGPPVPHAGGHDAIEEMLIEQMEAAHEAAMACLERAAADEATQEVRDRALMHATKLMSLFARQTDVLGRHRRRRPSPGPDRSFVGNMEATLAALATAPLASGAGPVPPMPRAAPGAGGGP